MNFEKLYNEYGLQILFLIGASLFITSLFGTAHAQTTFTINIPTGASDPNAPYFWQSEKDGSTTGVIYIVAGDTVVWENADTASHTVTSGTHETGPDEKFDSKLFSPGKSFILKFDNVGNFPYFCIIHPWMTGEVIVTEGLSTLPNVGKAVTDGDVSFDVKYRFSRLLANPQINVEQKSITFELIGNSKTSDHNLFLKLPSELLDGPYIIWADGKKLTDFQHEKDNGMNTLLIPLTEQTKVLTIVGTSVVPEFGIFTMIVLLSSITLILVMSAITRFQTVFRF